MTLDEHIAWIESRHNYWLMRLRGWAFQAGTPVSDRFEFALSIKDSGGKAAGYCHRQGVRFTCIYSLAYRVFLGDEYDETIAHEVAHAICKSIRPKSSWHGDFFLYVMQEVLPFPKHTIRHKYDWTKVKKISAIIKLKRQVEAA